MSKTATKMVAFFYKNAIICSMENAQKTLENSLFLNSFILDAHARIFLENKKLFADNEALKKQVDWFKQQFKLASHRQFGKSSETSTSMNLSMFDEKMEANPKEAAAESVKETITYTRSKNKKSVGRHIDVSKFPKEEKTHDLEEGEKTCCCGSALEAAGSDRSIQVDHIPETFKVIEHITLKYCCRKCETIKSAKKPETAIPKCMATAGFIAEVITKKYEQHLPL